MRPGPRIEPSPPSDKKRPLIAAAAGLAVGLLVFGVGGFFTGRATAPTTPDAKPTSTASPGGTALPLYEQSQVALNQSKFPTSLLTIAQGWMPYLNGCNRSGTPGGPGLGTGEKIRVRCSLGGMSAIFVEYESTADRDKARVTAYGQNVDARQLAPKVETPTEKPTPSGRTSGNYSEYAYTIEENKVERTVAGIRWDDSQTPVAGYLLAYWTDGLGSDWAPMRDLWGRYA